MDRINFIKHNKEYKLKSKDTILETEDETRLVYDNIMSVKSDKDNTQTIWCDKDRNGSYDTMLLIDKFGKRTVKKLDESKNKITIVQSRELSDFAKKANEFYKSQVDINGKIDNFAQGTAGDCWLLSGLKSLSNADEKIISQAISRDSKGNVIISFKGNNSKYMISPKEIYYADNRLSIGDDDVSAIELAVEKYRKKLAKNGENIPYLKNKLKVSTTNPLDHGTGIETGFLLTGKESLIVDDGKKEEFLEKLRKNPKAFANVVDFKNNKKNIIKAHAYTITSVDNKNVTLINPWDTKNKVKISKKDFIDNCNAFLVLN